MTEGCEVDHLISRDLGGADTLENLWPEPYTQHPGAHEKDWLETELNKEVCSGKITLKDAQEEIKTDSVRRLPEAETVELAVLSSGRMLY